MIKSQQKKIMQHFYEIKRSITDEELAWEIAMLKRKAATGRLGDNSELLYYRMGLDD